MKTCRIPGVSSMVTNNQWQANAIFSKYNHAVFPVLCNWIWKYTTYIAKARVLQRKCKLHLAAWSQSHSKFFPFMYIKTSQMENKNYFLQQNTSFLYKDITVTSQKISTLNCNNFIVKKGCLSRRWEKQLYLLVPTLSHNSFRKNLELLLRDLTILLQLDWCKRWSFHLHGHTCRGSWCKSRCTPLWTKKHRTTFIFPGPHCT